MSFGLGPILSPDCIGMILTYLPFKHLVKMECVSKSINKWINEKGDENTNKVGQLLLSVIKENYFNYFDGPISGSSRNWSMFPPEEQVTVKGLIKLPLSAFSSIYPAKLQECCPTRYSLGNGNSFTRNGPVIAVDDKGNIIMRGYRTDYLQESIIVLNKNLEEVACYNHKNHRYFKIRVADFERNTGSLYLAIHYTGNHFIVALKWDGKELALQWKSAMPLNPKEDQKFQYEPTFSNFITRFSQVFHIVDGLVYKRNPDACEMELISDTRFEQYSPYTIGPKGKLFIIKNSWTGRNNFTIVSCDLKSEDLLSTDLFSIKEASKVLALTLDSKNRILFVSALPNEEAICTCLELRKYSNYHQVWKYRFNYRSNMILLCDPRGFIILQTMDSIDCFDINNEKLNSSGSPIPYWQFQTDSYASTSTLVLDQKGRISFFATKADKLNSVLITLDPYSKNFDPKNPKPI
ncbi:MAG: hypothetical protein K1060chlam2_01309, partial [Chlamydiae bacterium]|nr:hypothetical protein [Chlamydiota bacterium]